MFRTGLASSGTVLRQAFHKWGTAVGMVVGLSVGCTMGGVAQARTAEISISVPTVTLVALPAPAQATHRLVFSGGPFPHAKDGSVFGNRERLLPTQPRGHYREYTVRTPGAMDRGARRIVCGGQPATQPAACFYTDDHYASFRRIVP